MNSIKCVVPKNDVVVRQLNGEQVLYNLRNGHCYGLDPVGACVWEHLETGRTIDWLAGFLSGRFQMDPDRGMSDLLRFTQDLTDHGLVEVLGH